MNPNVLWRAALRLRHSMQFSFNIIISSIFPYNNSSRCHSLHQTICIFNCR